MTEMTTAGPEAPPVGWLDTAELRVWQTYQSMSRGLAEELERQLQADSGIWLSDYAILGALSEAPEQRMRMGDLAEKATFSRSRLSHAVGRLESLGWVKRVRCPNDGRGTFAQLTSVGFEKFQDASAAHLAGVRKLFLDPLGPEGAEQMATLAARVRDAACDQADRELHR